MRVGSNEQHRTGRLGWLRVAVLGAKRQHRFYLEVERAELKADDTGERKELRAIYIARGLEPALANQVAEQLMVRDPAGHYERFSR